MRRSSFVFRTKPTIGTGCEKIAVRGQSGWPTIRPGVFRRRGSRIPFVAYSPDTELFTSFSHTGSRRSAPQPAGMQPAPSVNVHAWGQIMAPGTQRESGTSSPTPSPCELVRENSRVACSSHFGLLPAGDTRGSPAVPTWHGRLMHALVSGRLSARDASLRQDCLETVIAIHMEQADRSSWRAVARRVAPC